MPECTKAMYCIHLHNSRLRTLRKGNIKGKDNPKNGPTLFFCDFLNIYAPDDP